MSVTEPEIVAVYCVLAVRLVAGVNVAVLPLMLIEPMAAAPPAVGRREKLAVFRVAIAIVVENVADREEFSAKPVAPLPGDVAETVGGDWEACTVTDMSPGVSPPQPNKPRLVSSAAQKMRAEILDLIWMFDMREAGWI